MPEHVKMFAKSYLALPFRVRARAGIFTKNMDFPGNQVYIRFPGRLLSKEHVCGASVAFPLFAHYPIGKVICY